MRVGTRFWFGLYWVLFYFFDHYIKSSTHTTPNHTAQSAPTFLHEGSVGASRVRVRGTARDVLVKESFAVAGPRDVEQLLGNRPYTPRGRVVDVEPVPWLPPAHKPAPSCGTHIHIPCNVETQLRQCGQTFQVM